MGIAPAQTTYPKGAYPSAGVTRDSAGNLYGTTDGGGDPSCPTLSGCGVVYKVDTTGHESVLYRFTGADGANDGGNPVIAGVIADSAGNLYGTTDCGGTGTGEDCGVGAGVVYKLDNAGHETVLYSFTGGADGAYPNNVIRDSAGNLYGTTEFGGAAGQSVVYELDAAGQYTLLYSFTGGVDGGLPYAGVVRDSAGNLYGTTEFGGTAGQGVVYKLDAAGHETVLYSFTGGADGGYPFAGVIRDPAGNLYGTTDGGGAINGNCTFGCGVVFKVDPAGQETVLYSFTNEPDGAFPVAGVILDSGGNLYGTTQFGGSAGVGVVYKVEPAGQAPWPETVLYSFPAVVP